MSGMVRKAALVAMGFMAATPGISSATVVGSLSNFDVINDTGTEAHGFEIDLEGLHPSNITDLFGGPGRGFPTGRGFDPSTSVERYGAPTVAEYNNGSIFGTTITYLGLFDGVNWDYGTPSGTFITPGDNCWSGGGVGYGAGTPCDHFGVGVNASPAKTSYSWLVETSTPGVLSNGTANLPAPTWNVVRDPVNPAAPPLVAAGIEAPQPLGANEFGDALWVKVFTTEIEGVVELEDLIGGQPAIDQAVTEIEWQLLQVEIGVAGSGMLESGDVKPGANAEAVVRRYEFYAYGGAYDLENHEALPTGTDTSPDGNDLGYYLGAQNGAVNFNAIAPVPLPSALLLIGPGLLGLGAWRRARVA